MSQCLVKSGVSDSPFAIAQKPFQGMTSCLPLQVIMFCTQSRFLGVDQSSGAYGTSAFGCPAPAPRDLDQALSQTLIPLGPVFSTHWVPPRASPGGPMACMWSTSSVASSVHRLGQALSCSVQGKLCCLRIPNFRNHHPAFQKIW